MNIGENEIHVWYVDLTAQTAGSLSEEENERARRFRFDRDRTRFVAAHTALRTIVSAYAGVPPEALSFGEETLGKPFLAQPPAGVRFNLSHSGDVAAVAIAANVEMGIDLELSDRNVEDVESLARICFSAEERDVLAATTPEAMRVQFLRGWTRKEAYVKAIGKGLHMPIDQVHASFDDHRYEAAPGWIVIPLDPGARAIAALAAPSDRDWIVRERWLTDGEPGADDSRDLIGA